MIDVISAETGQLLVKEVKELGYEIPIYFSLLRELTVLCDDS